MTTRIRHSRVMKLDDRWQLNPQVALRPEPFGALLYHFGTRKLSFLKNTTIVEVVRSLPAHPNIRSALAAAGVAENAMPRYADALAVLVESAMIIPATLKDTAA